MAVRKNLEKQRTPGSWRGRIPLRWALMITTVLCAIAAFTAAMLESYAMDYARNAIYFKYITPYLADTDETGQYYTISPDGTTLYIESTMPYAYVNPDTKEVYPIETTSPSQFIPQGPLRFYFDNLSWIAVLTITLTILLAFVANALWFYHWKIKRPLAILNEASRKIGQNNLDFHVEAPSSDEMGRLCSSFETMRASLEENSRSLWAAVEERKRLNAAFSHDLRTPLTVLQGYSDLLLESLPSREITPEKTAETLATMKRSLTRLQRYVESMNSLQRLEDLTPQRTTVHFSSLEDQLRETGEILLGKNMFRFSSQGAGDLAIDTELLSQVYENLLSNSGRYAKSTVTVHIAREKNLLLLTVSDDGPGFPPEIKKRATEPYYRGDSSSPGEELHFGLGLYLCKILCQKHGGALQIGNGSMGAQITATFQISAT